MMPTLITNIGHCFHTPTKPFVAPRKDWLSSMLQIRKQSRKRNELLFLGTMNPGVIVVLRTAYFSVILLF